MNSTRRAFLASSAAALACAHEAPATYATRRERAAADGFFHVGNSTHLLVLDGVHVLTDPWVKDPADTIAQHSVKPAPLPVDVDVVLITHEHEDHYDTAALALIDKRAVVVAPTWLAAGVKKCGFGDVRAVKAGDALEVNGVHLDVVNGKHSCDEVVFVIEKGGKRVFFAGDTLPTPEIDRVTNIDLSILPCDAAALFGTRQVMNLDEAVQLGTRLGKHAVLTHHEYALTGSPFSVIADVKPVDTSKLPAWYRAPRPGDAWAWPWMEAS